MGGREGLPGVDLAVLDAAREDGGGGEAEQVALVVEVGPGGEVLGQRFALVEAGQGVDLVEVGGLGADGDEVLDAAELPLGEQVDGGDPAEAVPEQHDGAVDLREPVLDEVAQLVAAGQVLEDVTHLGVDAGHDLGAALLDAAEQPEPADGPPGGAQQGPVDGPARDAAEGGGEGADGVVALVGAPQHGVAAVLGAAQEVGDDGGGEGGGQFSRAEAAGDGVLALGAVEDGDDGDGELPPYARGGEQGGEGLGRFGGEGTGAPGDLGAGAVGDPAAEGALLGAAQRGERVLVEQSPGEGVAVVVGEVAGGEGCGSQPVLGDRRGLGAGFGAGFALGPGVGIRIGLGPRGFGPGQRPGAHADRHSEVVAPVARLDPRAGSVHGHGVAQEGQHPGVGEPAHTRAMDEQQSAHRSPPSHGSAVPVTIRSF